MKKQYEESKIEIVYVENDVLTSSVDAGGTDAGGDD